MSDLTHVERIRQELPATAAYLYLNTGTFGPIPRTAAQTMEQWIERELQEGRLSASSFERIGGTYESARQGVARLLHADDEEIALTDNTGEGLNIISNGLDWQAGDEVITTNHEHISMLAPLYQLRSRYGIVIRQADLGKYAERPALQAVMEAVTPRTKLIAISHVAWTTGVRLDISEIGLMGRERGIPVLIDGAQSAGAIPLDVHALNVDFYAIPGQKWLCGPDGTGALYASHTALHHATPTFVGYWSAKDMHAETWAVKENARRYEVGGRQTAAIAGQAATLNWLENTVGHQWMHEHIAALNIYASQAVQTVPGLTLLSPRPGDSGLLTVKMADAQPEDVVKYLRENYRIAIRTIGEMGALRISTGFYNTEQEIDTLVSALTAYQPSH